MLRVARNLAWPIIGSVVCVGGALMWVYAWVSFLYLHPKTWFCVGLVIFFTSVIKVIWPFTTGQYQKEQEKIKEEQKRDVEALEEQKRSVEALNEKVQRLSKKIETMKELKTKQLPVTSLTFEQISQNTNAISQAVRRLDKDIEIELKKHKGE